MVTAQTRLAMRFLTAKDAASVIDDYKSFLNAFVTYDQVGVMGWQIDRFHYDGLITEGRNLSRWVVETRAIPQGKAKAVEMAARVFARAKLPSDVLGWYRKNKAAFEFLLEAATTWGSRETSDDELAILRVPPFDIHNTIGASGPKLLAIKTVVDGAIHAIGRHHGLSRVLYGNVFVVGQIRGGHTAAWYHVKDDAVFVRSGMKGRGDIHNLCHELGHRYWYRFMTDTRQMAWDTLYRKVSYATPDPPPPKVGDLYPLPISGRKEAPRIVGVENGNYLLEGGGYTPIAGTLRTMGDNARRSRFPTPYSAKSPEEFFAESFALFVLGALPTVFREDFERVVQG